MHQALGIQVPKTYLVFAFERLTIQCWGETGKDLRWTNAQVSTQSTAEGRAGFEAPEREMDILAAKVTTEPAAWRRMCRNPQAEKPSRRQSIPNRGPGPQ